MRVALLIQTALADAPADTARPLAADAAARETPPAVPAPPAFAGSGKKDRRALLSSREGLSTGGPVDKMLVFQSLLETEMDLQSKARTMEQIKDQLKLEEIQGHKVLEGMSYFDSDPTYIKNNADIRKKLEEKGQDLAVAWQEKFNQAKRTLTAALQQAERKMHDEYNELSYQYQQAKVEVETTVTRLSGDLDRIPPVLKGEESKYKDLLKQQENMLSLAEKMFSKEMKGTNKDWAKKKKDQDKVTITTMKRYEKDFARTEKAFEKNVKKLSKASDKLIKKEEKNFERDTKTIDKWYEELTEDLDESYEQLEELSSEAGSFGELMAKDVDKLIDSNDASNPGLNVAIEQATEMGEKMLEQAEGDVDKSEAEAAVELEDVGKAIEESMEEAQEEYSESAIEAEQEVAQFSSEAGGEVKTLGAEMGQRQSEIRRKIQSQAKEVKKLETTFGSAEKQFYDVQAEANDRIASFQTNTEGKISKYSDFTGDKLKSIEDGQSSYIDAEKNSLDAQIGRNTASVQAKTDMDLKKISASFADALGSESKTLETVQQQVDDMQGQKQYLDQTIKGISNTEEELRGKIEDLPKISEQTQDTAHSVLQDLQKSFRKMEEDLDKSEDVNTKSLNDQAGQAQVLMAKTQKEVGDTVLAKLGKLNEEASTLEGESQKAKESDMEMGRQVTAKVDETRAVVESVQSTLTELGKGIRDIDGQAANELGSAAVSGQELQSEAKKKADETLEGVKKNAKKMVQTMVEELKQMLSTANEGANNKVGEIWGNIQSAEDREQKQNTDLESVLQALQSRVALLKKGLGDEKTSVEDQSGKTAEELEQTQKKIESLESEADEKRKNLGMTIEQKILAATQEFKRLAMQTLSEEKDKASSEYAGADAAVRQELENTNSQIKTVEGQTQQTIQQAEDAYGQAEEARQGFEKWFNGDGKADAEKALDEAAKAAGVVAESKKDVAAMSADLDADAAELKHGVAAEFGQAERDAYAALQAGVKGVQNKLTGAMAGVDADAHKLHDDFQREGADIAQQAHGAEAADRALMVQVLSAGKTVDQEKRNSLAKILAAMRKLKGESLSEEDKLRALQLHEQGILNAQSEEGRRIRAAIMDQENSIENEVSEMDHTLAQMVLGLDPSGMVAEGQSKLQLLKRVMSSARKLMNEKADQMQDGVNGVRNELGTVGEEASSAEVLVQKAIMDASNEQRIEMAKVAKEHDEIVGSVTDLVHEMDDLAVDLHKAVKGRVGKVQRDFNLTKQKIDGAMQLEQYQSDDAVKDVIELLDKSQAQTDSLIKHQKEVVEPSISTWRGGVEKVFASLGLALSQERIARLAEESAAMEGADSSILTAEEQMQKKISDTSKELHNQVRKIWSDFEARRAEIMAMDGKSHAWKEAEIARLRQEATQSAASIMSGARDLLAEQKTAIQSIDQDLIELDSLLERADMLMRSSGGPEAHAKVLALVAELQRKMTSLRTTYITGQSLMQFTEEVNQDDAIALRASEEGMRKLEAERKPQDAELEKALTLMEGALTKIPKRTVAKRAA